MSWLENSRNKPFVIENSGMPPLKKRRLAETQVIEKDIPTVPSVYDVQGLTIIECADDKKEKNPSLKTQLKDEIIEVLNDDIVSNNHEPYKSSKFYTHSPIVIYKAYLQTKYYKRNGPNAVAWQKLFKFVMDKQTQNTFQPAKELRIKDIQLNSDDQYIRACAELYIQKNCLSQNGQYKISPLSFSVLPEEVKSDVYYLLTKMNVSDTNELEEYLYVPKYVRELYQQAPELLRNGVSTVTMQYDLNQIIRNK